MTITRMCRIAAGLALGLSLSAAAAVAAPIVSVTPVQQTANVGDTVFVDIDVSGLTEPVGGFSLLVGFDDTILSPVGHTIGAGLGANLDLSDPPANPYFLYAFSLEDPGDLAALQGSGFTLARLEFLATANGISPISLSSVDLSNADGTALLPGVVVRNGQVCVGGPCPVPEPVTGTLVLAGLAAMALRRVVRA